jgi:hypothetical protein
MNAGYLCGRVRPSAGKVREMARSVLVRVRKCGPLYRAAPHSRTPGDVLSNGAVGVARGTAWRRGCERGRP